MISKLVPLIMLPIVTRIMTDSYYFGLNNISTVVVNFGTAIAIMDLYDAMYRMFFDKEDDEEYKKEICSTALIFTSGTSLLIFLTLLMFKKFLLETFF